MIGKRYYWFSWLVVVAMVLMFSPSLRADQSVFNISEDLLRSFESQKAFEQYMAENNFHLTNRFPFLQYDLLPVPLDAKYAVIQKPSFDQVYFAQKQQEQQAQETGKGKVLGQYSIFPTEFMNLVLYQNNANLEQEGVLSSQMKGQFGEYTIEAQSTVVNGFKISYGYDAAKGSVSTQKYGLGLETNFRTQNAGVELRVLPGMSLNADYKKSIKGTGLDEAYKRLNLAYNPGSFASFNAGYGILSKTSFSSDSLVFPTAIDGRVTTNLEDIIIKQLGLSLQPTNYSQFSADYIFVNERGEPTGSSTAKFGLRLGDRSKEFNAIYQLENGENHKTVTSAGVELGFVDLASLSAVYSTTEDHQFPAGVQRSTVDLGLNVNLATNSTFHFQYKLVLPENQPDEEQTAEAKLVFNF